MGRKIRLNFSLLSIIQQESEIPPHNTSEIL